MSAWIIRPERLIEPAIAPEFFIDGIGAIELIGDQVRVYLVTRQLPLEGGAGPPQSIATVKIVGSLRSVPAVIGQLAHCLWVQKNPLEIPPRPRPYLVT